MLTSYYFSMYLSDFKENVVRISTSYPKDIEWLKDTRIYRPLCPSWDLVSLYKSQQITESGYVGLYADQLNRLNPITVYRELGEKSILCCWERPEKFCHRQIVAKWLHHHLKIDIRELEGYGTNRR